MLLAECLFFSARAVNRSETCEQEGFRRLRGIVTGSLKKYLNTSVSSSAASGSGAPAVHLDQLGGGSNPARAVSADLRRFLKRPKYSGCDPWASDLLSSGSVILLQAGGATRWPHHQLKQATIGSGPTSVHPYATPDPAAQEHQPTL